MSSWQTRYFYPRPPRGGRQAEQRLYAACDEIFLSTPSARRATWTCGSSPGWAWISIHALREEGDCTQGSDPLSGRISIHALREEGDAAFHAVSYSSVYFYPRPPRGGRRRFPCRQLFIRIFLSTPSARRATAKAEKKSSAFVLLYIFLHKLKRAFGKNADGTAPLLIDSFAFSARSVPGNTVCLWFAQCRDQKINTLSCAKFGCRPTCSTLVW